MKKIKLTQDQYAIVDDDDYEMVMSLRWRYNKYALTTIYENGVRICDFPMHRLINNTPAGFDTDHINQNRLDNRKSNLRTATRSQNNYNSDNPKDNKSGVKGVIWHKQGNKWWAYATLNGKQHSLGLYKIKQQAIKARQRFETENSICV